MVQTRWKTCTTDTLDQKTWYTNKVHDQLLSAQTTCTVGDLVCKQHARSKIWGCTSQHQVFDTRHSKQYLSMLNIERLSEAPWIKSPLQGHRKVSNHKLHILFLNPCCVNPSMIQINFLERLREVDVNVSVSLFRSLFFFSQVKWQQDRISMCSAPCDTQTRPPKGILARDLCFLSPSLTRNRIWLNVRAKSTGWKMLKNALGLDRQAPQVLRGKNIKHKRLL